MGERDEGIVGMDDVVHAAVCILARSQGGLRPTGAASARGFCFTPFLIAATPCSLRNLVPLGTGAGCTIGMPLKLESMGANSRTMPDPAENT